MSVPIRSSPGKSTASPNNPSSTARPTLDRLAVFFALPYPAKKKLFLRFGHGGHLHIHARPVFHKVLNKRISRCKYMGREKHQIIPGADFDHVRHASGQHHEGAAAEAVSGIHAGDMRVKAVLFGKGDGSASVKAAVHHQALFSFIINEFDGNFPDPCVPGSAGAPVLLPPLRGGPPPARRRSPGRKNTSRKSLTPISAISLGIMALLWNWGIHFAKERADPAGG
ncbi:MAG: hypothetical protein ACM3WV_11155 [Bacillota bacterium]